jgi:FKBP-type peptidyl-prolyl cis-trans isomerase 2
MAEAVSGDKVRVHYTGRLDNDEDFDSSLDRGPLEIVLGAGAMIAGFEAAIIGMTEGDSKTVVIPAAHAYGPRQEDRVQEVDITTIPAGFRLEEGMQLQGTGPDDKPVALTVTEMTEDSVTMDSNHPLAGQDLTFDIELIEILAGEETE